MSMVSTPLADSAIMLRRNLRHTLRNPVTVFHAMLFPVVTMLLFVKVFGGAFSVGEAYVDYATPGLLVMAVCCALGATATAVNDDMTKGLINRFKAMDVSHGSVLTGHVVVTTVRCLAAETAVVGVAFALGLDPAASALDWLAALGLLVLLAFGAGWCTVAIGLSADSARTAGLATLPLIMLPFVSSAFAPADSMGAGLRQFARYQPFTPVVETLRGLLAGDPSGTDALAAVAWCAGFALVGYLWAHAALARRA